MPWRSGLHPKPNRSPVQRVRFGSEEQQNERAMSCWEEDAKARRQRYVACDELVRLKGLEPTRIAAREPKSRMSTNSITGAYSVFEITAPEIEQ